jgi:hypothetical protein
MREGEVCMSMLTLVIGFMAFEMHVCATPAAAERPKRHLVDWIRRPEDLHITRMAPAIASSHAAELPLKSYSMDAYNSLMRWLSFATWPSVHIAFARKTPSA